MVTPKPHFDIIYNEANLAGKRAADACTPIPMVVTNGCTDWHVPDGVCGFAWVVVKPATTAFARWLKSNDLARKHYYGGYSIWIHSYNQSMQRKIAHANAMVKVFQSYGIKCYAGSRMD